MKPFRVPSPREERVAVVEPLAGRGVVDNGPYDVEPPTGVTMKFLCLAYGAKKDWKALLRMNRTRSWRRMMSCGNEAR